MRILLLLLLLAGPLRAEIEVDMELVLAVDVSRSMSPMELEIQRRGYAEALTSDEVLKAIERGFLGRIAVTYVEWAGVGSQRIIAEWMVIETPEDAKELADRISFTATAAMRRTSISEGLVFAADMFEDNGFTSYRRVIDISGDGPNNQGIPVTRARDLVVERDITINGLPLMTRDGYGHEWNIDDLDVYYENCVIGGIGAFAVPVRDWSEFARAVRRKLVLEISGLGASGYQLAQVENAPTVDCLIGEKIWQRNRNGMGLP